VNPVVRDVLKWVVTLGLLAGVSFYALDALPDALGNAVSIEEEDGGDDSLGDLPVEGAVIPVKDGIVLPSSDFTIANSLVGDRTATQLVIGEEAGAAVVLAFPLNAGSPSCVVDVRLEVQVEQATPTTLGVYPSAIGDLDEVTANAAPPAAAILDPAGVEEMVAPTPGRIGFNVTEMYRTWVSGAPFPGGSQAPESDQFVVTLSPPAAAPEAGRQVVMSAADAGDETAPTLGFVGDPACRVTVPAPGSSEAVPPAAASPSAQPA